MDYLNLIASIGLAMAVLGLTLIIQSRTLLVPSDRLPLLGRKLKTWSYILGPLGALLVLIGIFVFGNNISFISVGMMLILLAVALVAQGEALQSSKDALEKLGKKIRIYAWLYAIIGFIVVVAIGVVSIYLFLQAA